MFSMGFSTAEMRFNAVSDTVGTDFYVQSGEWEIISTRVLVGNDPLVGLPWFQVCVHTFASFPQGLLYPGHAAFAQPLLTKSNSLINVRFF